MKNALLSLLLFFCISNTYAQIGIKANGTAPIASAQLEVQSTTKAFYPPRMTTAQKNAIVSPQVGAIVYDTDLIGLSLYNGSAWGAVSGSAGLTLPYSQTGNDAGSNGLFKITDNGTNINGRAVSGISNVGFGVIGISTSGAGVQGTSTSSNGVAGSSNSAIGVRGFSETNFGISGSSNTGDGGVFSSTSGRALRTIGRISFSGTGVGTLGTGKFLKSINNAGDAEWSDLFPLSVNQSSSSNLLNIINTGTGYTIFAGKQGIGGSAIFASSESSTGLIATTFTGTGIVANAFSTGIAAYFESNGGHALIAIGGNTGIGVNDPTYILDVKSRMRLRHSTETSGLWLNNSSNVETGFLGMVNDTQMGFFIGGGWRFGVTSAGNATLTGTLTQSSDRRLKKEINPLTHSLSSIYNINGYHYKWIEASRSQDLQTGLIAQEIQKIFPELVQTDEKGFLSVNYIGLIPHLIEAVKELKTVNEKLDVKNQSLENRLEKIESQLISAKQ